MHKKSKRVMLAFNISINLNRLRIKFPCTFHNANNKMLLVSTRGTQNVTFVYHLFKGGDPAAPSDTATLLRLYPNHWFYLRQLPPLAWLARRLRVPPTLMA